jgi:hypothetical protein
MRTVLINAVELVAPAPACNNEATVPSRGSEAGAAYLGTSVERFAPKRRSAIVERQT